jgi:hypothetical protein
VGSCECCFADCNLCPLLPLPSAQPFLHITHPGSPWRVWSCARPRRDGDVRYQFVVYTREAPADTAAAAAGTAAGGVRARQLDAVGTPPVLPPGVCSQHDEFQVSARGCVWTQYALLAVEYG